MIHGFPFEYKISLDDFMSVNNAERGKKRGCKKAPIRSLIEFDLIEASDQQ
jgi:hypothetical protein